MADQTYSAKPPVIRTAERGVDVQAIKSIIRVMNLSNMLFWSSTSKELQNANGVRFIC